MPITMMFAADVLGVGYGQYARDYRVMADAQLKTAEMFGLDYVSTISDPAREASDLGGKIQWYDDQPPAIVENEALFTDKRVFAGFKVPDRVAGGRMEDRIRGVELLRSRVGQDLLVEGWVEGPCAESADLRGINHMMTDFSDDPAFIQDLFEFTVEVATRFAAAATLGIPQLHDGARIVTVSQDPRQALCYQCHAPREPETGSIAATNAWGPQVGSGDDRTPMGVHEGISCVSCHDGHNENTRASCKTCHPQMSNYGIDMEKMDTTYSSATSAHNIHWVKCTDCHQHGIPKAETPAPHNAKSLATLERNG
jgi:hypothetical protein